MPEGGVPLELEGCKVGVPLLLYFACETAELVVNLQAPLPISAFLLDLVRIIGTPATIHHLHAWANSTRCCEITV